MRVGRLSRHCCESRPQQGFLFFATSALPSLILSRFAIPLHRLPSLLPPPPSNSSQLASHGPARHHLRVGDRIMTIDGKSTQVYHNLLSFFVKLIIVLIVYSCFAMLVDFASLTAQQGLSQSRMRELMLGDAATTVQFAIGEFASASTFLIKNQFQQLFSPRPG